MNLSQRIRELLKLDPETEIHYVEKPKGKRVKAKNDRRVECYGGCGKHILHFYNPSGYCRKCTRANRVKAERMDTKRRLQAKGK